MNLKRFKKEEGTTIIEVVVVMAIIAILSTITLGLVTSLFDSSLRTSKYLDQNNRIETMYGFFASRMASTNIGSVGLPGTGKIDPLTLAGDQFVFQSNGGGSTTGATLCYRVMYFKQDVVWGANATTDKFPANSIWVAVSGVSGGSPSSPCDSIKPKVGPNGNASAIEASSDPVLDPADGSNPAGNPFQLAANIDPENTKFDVSQIISGETVTGGGPNVCGGAGTEKTYQKALVPFMFCNVSLGKLPVSNFAGVGTEGSFYSPTGENTVESLLRDVRAVQVNAYVKASGESSPVPVREYTQVFSLAQVCATETQVELTLPAPKDWRKIGLSSDTGTETDPFFETGWEGLPDSKPTPALYLDAEERVYLRGAVRRTSGSSLNTVIFTLPYDLSPPAPYSQIFLIPRGTGGGTATIEITTTSSVAGAKADVKVNGVSASPALNVNDVYYLDGISFRVSQNE